MHEHILARGALDKPVALRPVKPLDSSLLSHKKLLSPLQRNILPSLIFVCPWEAGQPPQRTDRIRVASHAGKSHQQKRLPKVTSRTEARRNFVEPRMMA